LGGAVLIAFIIAMKKCSKCKKIKKLTSFYKSKSNKDGLQYKCIDCVKQYDAANKKNASKRQKRHRKTPEGAAMRCLNGMKMRAKQRGFSPPEFTFEDILDIFQNSKCEVTGRKPDLMYESKYHMNPFRLSPDRKDNSKGYTKGNVRWVMCWINVARGQYDIEDFKKWVKGAKW
jgi:hypothetical protein